MLKGFCPSWRFWSPGELKFSRGNVVDGLGRIQSEDRKKSLHDFDGFRYGGDSDTAVFGRWAA